MRRFLLISLGVHAAAALIALAVMLAPRARDPRLAMADLPDNMTPVEVVRAPGADASPPPSPQPAPETPPAEQAAPAPAPPEPEAEGGAPASPPEPEQKQAAAAQPAPEPAPEKPDMHVDLGAAGLTDDVEGEDMVPPGPDPLAQNIPPRYPRDAAMKGERGTVELLVKVSPLGMVDDAEVVRSSGYDSLDEAARKAVLRWRFTPATEGGVAHESEQVQTFTFHLE